MDSSAREPRPRSAAPVPRPTRLPFVARKRQARREAAARVVARTSRPLSPAQLARDPLAREPRGSATRWLRLFGATFASIGVHLAVVGVGFLTGGMEHGRREVVEQKIAIEVREPPPPPPEPPKAEKAAEPPTPPKVAKAPPPPKAKAPAPPPEEAPKTPPPRVVGLSFESTSEGGGGPAFAVGNTRMGATAERAASPQEVPKEAPEGGDPAPGENKVASRLPSSGVTYTAPRRKHQPKLNYPETLKVQGVEAFIKVSLSIDATGKVTAVRVLNPSVYPEFNEAAKRLGFSEEFEPALRDGIPIPYSIAFTYRYELKDE